MAELTSFRSVIELWDTREAMALDIGAKPSAVSKWWQRDSVPDEWWSAVLATEKARSSDLTADVMVRLAARTAPCTPVSVEPRDEVRA